MMRSSRAALTASAAMGVVSFAGLAQAQSCEVQRGVIECGPGSYDEIVYSDVDLHLTGDIYAEEGILLTGDGDIALTASDDSIIRVGPNAYGVVVSNASPSTQIDLNEVQTAEGSVGVYVIANGPADISIDRVLSLGPVGVAVQASETRIDIGTIDQRGSGVALLYGGGTTWTEVDEIRLEQDSLGVLANTFDGELNIGVGQIIFADDAYGYGLIGQSTGGGINVAIGRISGGAAANSVNVASESGEISISVISITDTADNGDTISASSGSGNVEVVVDQMHVTETSDWDVWGGAAIAAYSGTGSVNVVAGEIELDGPSAGVVAAAGGGVRIYVDQMTMADYAGGGVRASSTAGDIDITVGRLIGGESSYGVEASSDSGDITVNAEYISFGGSDSGGSGISIDGGSGRIDVTAGHVSASNETAGGIVINNTTGDIHITAGDVFAYEFAAIGAYSDSGDIFVTANGDIASGEYAALDLSTSGAVTLTIGAAGSVSVDEWAQVSRIRGDEGVSILNLGTIRADEWSPAAFTVTGGALTLENRGLIVGMIDAADGIRFDNVGTWRPNGEMAFRGDDDLLINTGVIRPLHTDPGCCFDPARVTLTGLETLQNAGLIDLRGGGSTQNRFDALNTTYIGQAGAVIAVDFDLSDGSADQLRFGAIQGQSTLTINYVGEGGGFAPAATVISSTAAASSDAIVLDPGSATSGFTQIMLDYDADARAFTLQALPSDAALTNLRLGWAAQDYAAKSGEAWSGRLEDLRDSLWAGTRRGGVEVWAQALMGERTQDQVSDFVILNTTVRRDISTETDWRGVQYGVDRAFGPVTLGVTGGYLDYDMTSRARPDRFSLHGFNLGAYAAYLNGPFSLTGLAKVDRFESRAALRSVDDFNRMDGTAWDAQVEAAWRFDVGPIFMEPVASADFIRAELDDLIIAGATASYSELDSLKIKLGVRGGGRIDHGALILTPSAGLYVTDERLGENVMDFAFGASGFSVADQPYDAHGRADLALGVSGPGGLAGWVKGEVDFGDGARGATLRLGGRWSW